MLEGVHVSASDANIHVKALIPVRVQGLLNDAGGPRLLAIDGCHRERVGEAREQEYQHSSSMPPGALTVPTNRNTSLLYRPSAAMTVRALLVCV